MIYVCPCESKRARRSLANNAMQVAIKTIKKAKIETEADLIRIRREIQIMSSVRHPNIIHIYEVFENKEKMVLVMEYAAGGELYDYLSQRKVLSETEARRVFRQVASAVYYCHKVRRRRANNSTTTTLFALVVDSLDTSQSKERQQWR